MTEKLSLLGSRLITTVLPLIAAGSIVPRAQDNSKATLAPLLKKKDGLIDWTWSAVEIHNRVRGLSPWPGAYTYVEGKMLKIVESEVIAGKGEPGVVSESEKDTLAVGTGSGLLRIVRVQPEGRTSMTAGDFLRGHRGVAGKTLSGQA
jgi:methionyl-tRNA formyltransferase